MIAIPMSGRLKFIIWTIIWVAITAFTTWAIVVTYKGAAKYL